MQGTGLVSLRVKERGDLVHGTPCSQHVVGEGTGRQACVSGRRSLKTRFTIWPEKRLAWEIENRYDNHATRERIVISEKREASFQCALVPVGTTPGESPMKLRCPYWVV